MRGSLVQNRSLITVPAGLTYFTRGGTHLVVNPAVGARCPLTTDELLTLKALDAGGGAVAEDERTERTIAKLILNWIVYYDGNAPTVRESEPPLRYTYYAVTDGCNLRCPYCYASSEKCLPGELSTAESMDLITQIAELGSEFIVFTGGEPMLRKDLFQLVEHANAVGLRANIITNATMIRKQETADRFAELFNAITVSMDGGTAERHDKTRGKGSFDKTVAALRMLNAAGVRPNINHIVTSENVAELEHFATMMQDVKVRAIRLMNHDDLGRGVGDGYDFGWTDHLRVQRLVWTSPVASHLMPDGPRPVSPCSIKGNCGMGGNEIYINSIGNVFPCKLVTGPEHFAGNVRVQPLAELLGGPLLGGMRRSTVFGGEYHEDCARCYIKASCGGGCRATHMSQSGDIRRNSRHMCRVLRHGVVTQLWREVGATRADLAEHDQEMTVPRLVSDDSVHGVYEDWKTYVPTKEYVPTPPGAIRVDTIPIPITPV